MQAIFELLAGFIALLVVACLSQFGVDLKSAPSPEREIHRISDCRQAPTGPRSLDSASPGC